MSEKGFVFDIKRYSINDGPGIRTTVFLKGCPLNCLWCHNPESRILKPQSVKRNSYTWSFYSLSCNPDIIGKEVSSEEIISEIVKDIPFYEESGGGVTFSGGEPLLQYEFLYTMLSLCKEKGIHTVVDTSGYSAFSIFNKIYDLTDIFLYDIKIFNDELHLKYTGVSNKVILNNLERLSRMGDKIIVRIPVIPGLSNTEENICSTTEYLKKLNIRAINLLPFHNSALLKYRRLNIDNKLQHLETLSADEMNLIKTRFAETGKPVFIGG